MQIVEDATFANKVRSSAHPVAVLFHSEWCTTCKEMMPTIEEVATELDGKMRFVKIDFDDNTQSAVECGVLVVPTIVLFKDGKSVNRIVGLQDKLKLRQQFSPHVNWD